MHVLLKQNCPPEINNKIRVDFGSNINYSQDSEEISLLFSLPHWPKTADYTATILYHQARQIKTNANRLISGQKTLYVLLDNGSTMKCRVMYGVLGLLVMHGWFDR